MKKVYYYSDELNDDFACTRNIKSKGLPDDYKFVPKNRAWKTARFFVHKVLITPIAILLDSFMCGIKNRRVLKGYKNKGAFLYGNHTSYFVDAANPTRIAYPRTADIITSADAVSIKVCGALVRLLGAIPLPESISGLKNFSADVAFAAESGHWIAIYPEAHIWPYYTGIRPYPATSFKYAAKSKLPVFSFTTVHRKRLLRRKPKRVTYIDGPFFADEALNLKERAESLRKQVYDTMCERSKLNNCEYIKYCKVNSAELAAVLNGATSDYKKKRRVIFRVPEAKAEDYIAEQAEEMLKAEKNSI